MSTDAHADALKALLATATKAPVYDLDEAQALAALPDNYTLLFLSRRAGGEYRGDGTRSTSLRRLTTRVVAKTVTNGRLIEDRIAAAFEFTTVNLGDVTTQVDYESGGGSFEADDGYYSAATDWTFRA